MNRIFQKPLPNHSTKQIKFLFTHSCAVHDGLSLISHCSSPKPLTYDPDGIGYEFIDVPENSLSEELQAQSCAPNTMHKAGEVLAMLHQDKTPSLLHSDYVPHNVFQTNDGLLIIDAHPPENLGYREDLLYGTAQRDIVSFTSCIFSNVGLQAIKTNPQYYHEMANAFLSGYKTARPLPTSFISTIFAHARDTYRMKRIAGISFLRALGHATLYGLITWHTIITAGRRAI